MDSDDLITSHMLEEVYTICSEKKLDVLYFSGTSFFENDDLEKEHEWYLTAYYRNGDYKEVMDGPHMLKALGDYRSYYVSPCLQIIRNDFMKENNLKFPEGIIHEDNSFTFKTLMSAQRVFCVNDIYFYRRVRNNSIVTKSKTHRNLWGYFYCLLDQLQYVKDIQADDIDINHRIAQVLASLNRQVRMIYADLPIREQELFISQCNAYEKIVFKSMILENAQIQKRNENEIKHLAHQNEIINKRLLNIKNSYSYKIGRKITAPYRLVNGGVKCCLQHGLFYTCKLTVKKLKNRLR